MITNNKKILPLGIFSKTTHIHPQNPTKQVLYNVKYPGFQKKLIKIKEHKKGIDITWRLQPPTVVKSKKTKTTQKKNIVKTNKNKISGCSKHYITNLLNNSNINNYNKLLKIQEKCSL